MSLSFLFQPYRIKDLTLRNRIVMSPMCQYSVWAEDGRLNDWHFVHYVSRAVGGTGLILVEMTDVAPEGRISARDSGIWSDAHIEPLARIADAVHGHQARFGVQIAHAGRKAQEPSWDVVAPSAIRFSESLPEPRALSTEECQSLVDRFADGARRAVAAGADVIELHGAHGYLLNQFMSPGSNHRRDRYGDPARFVTEVVQAVKAVMPGGMPLFMRVSAVEYSDEGYTLDQLVALCAAFHRAGVDLFDVSSGSNYPTGPTATYPGYQVPYAARIRRDVEVPVMAVGRLEDPLVAEAVVGDERADLVAVGRGHLQNPYWANAAALALHEPIQVPWEYYRAFPDAPRPQ